MFKHLSVRSKLLLMLLAISVLTTASIAYIAFINGQRALNKRIFDQLTSERVSKATQIETYFDTLTDEVLTLGESLMTVEAMSKFKEAYADLGTADLPPNAATDLQVYYDTDFLPQLNITEDADLIADKFYPSGTKSQYLQYHYMLSSPLDIGERHMLDDPKDGSRYSGVHQRYHPIFRNVVERFGFYDLFLIDHETGDIIYSVFKETDYATSLYTGPYNSSNLAKVVEQARSRPGQGFVQIADFQAYRPSYGAPASFIATPIYNGSVLVGILAIQVPVDNINDLMTNSGNWSDIGLGESGETYLVGRDLLMRSNSRFLVDDRDGYLEKLTELEVDPLTIKRIDEFNTSILLQEVRTGATDAIFKGQTGTEIIDDYRGVRVLSSFAPLQISGVKWGIMAEMDESEALMATADFQRQIMIAALILTLLTTLLAMLFSSVFVRPINGIVSHIRRITAGETAENIPVSGSDEFSTLATDFNTLLDSQRTQSALIEQKNAESEQLLNSLFSPAIAQRLKDGEANISNDINSMSVVFAKIYGFTELSESLGARNIVGLLNELVSAFDDAAVRHGVEKIKTNGGDYVAACGVNEPRLDHAQRAIEFAQAVQDIVVRTAGEHDVKLEVSIGIDAGEGVGAVVGKHKFIYDVWGEPVDTATTIGNSFSGGDIHVSQDVYELLQSSFPFTEAGTVEHRDGKLAVYALANGEGQ